MVSIFPLFFFRFIVMALIRAFCEAASSKWLTTTRRTFYALTTTKLICTISAEVRSYTFCAAINDIFCSSASHIRLLLQATPQLLCAAYAWHLINVNRQVCARVRLIGEKEWSGAQSAPIAPTLHSFAIEFYFIIFIWCTRRCYNAHIRKYICTI